MGDIIIGHKERPIWLPSHHAHQDQKSVKNHNHNHNHHRGNGGFRRPTGPSLGESLPLNNSTRQKQSNNWQRSKGEERMQAFFLVSPGRTTSGTGVFLPSTAFHPPTKKPACSPVLLPARVVQALKLNVHNNNLHISPRSEVRDQNDESKKKVVTSVDTKVETPMDSPEKLLPEEWIY